MVTTPFLWPGQDPAYPLGSDSLGRDVISGLFWGARISLLVGLAATALGLSFGALVGAVAGYFGGWVDDLLVRFIEIFQTLPSFVLLVVLVAIAQPTAPTIIVAIAIVSWPTVARLTRAEFRAIREKDFVMAARSLGYGHARIIFREILPNALAALIVTSSVMVASAILMEAALSFMGAGRSQRGLLGLDDRRGQGGDPHRLVFVGAAGPRHRLHRAGAQPDRRRPSTTRSTRASRRSAHEHAAERRQPHRPLSDRRAGAQSELFGGGGRDPCHCRESGRASR